MDVSAESLTLFQAWWRWWHPMPGQALADVEMWGHRILWWGRLGKLMEFAAGMTIVIDVIGPDRLQAAGDWLHSWFSLVGASKELLRALFRLWSNLRTGTRWLMLLGRRYRMALLSVVILGFFSFFTASLLNRFLHLEWQNRWVILIAVPGMICLVLLYALAVALVLLAMIGISLVLLRFAISFLLFSIGLLVDLLVLEPTALVLRLPHADKLIKGAAAVLILVGFHFDLLTS